MKKIILFALICCFLEQGHSQLSFSIASSPAVGSQPRGIAMADVNGDGWPDVITVSGANNTLSVMTNNGHGGFVLSSSPAIGNNSNPVLAVDVNGDGKVDLVSASYSLDSLSILTNNGNGGFVLSSSPGVGEYPLLIAAADVNGDGKVDLIVPNSGASTVSVLTNNGFGGFVSSGTYSVGFNPWDVCAADVNGDGKVDLITANYGGNSISVLTNNGSGGFATSATYAIGSGNHYVVAADVNGDGKIDIICANYTGNTITVLTNNGSGGFVLSANYSVGSDPGYIAAADFNGDGKIDLAVANYGSSSVTVLTNNGGGGFVLGATIAVGSNPWSIAAADVNGDGKPDIITANNGANTISVLTNGTPFPAPVITSQPTNESVYVGKTATFSVMASGAGPLSYQWSFNGTNILNATNASISLANVPFSEAGNYSVLVSNNSGSTNSATAVLTVNALPPCDSDTSGIVAWWPAEGNANDIVGGNNGNLEGGLGFASGEVGQAFSFAETNGYVDVPATPALNLGAYGGFTIEEWISPSNVVSQMPLFGWGTNAYQVSVTNIILGPILNTNNGHYYYMLSSDTWSNSQATGVLLGGNLATIRSLGEELWVSNTFANYGGIQRGLWIGLYDPTKDTLGGQHVNNFQWIDGENVTFRDWAGGQPDNCSGGEYYVMIYAPYPTFGANTGGEWNDIDNAGDQCNIGGYLTNYAIIEATNLSSGAQSYLWTSVGGAGCLYMNLLDSTNGVHILSSSGGVLQSNVYQHIAFTYNTNSGVGTLYLNGSVVALTNWGSFVPNTLGDVYLGKRLDGNPSDVYSGGMDEVTVYSRVLSPTEIQGVCQAGIGGKCYTPSPPVIISEPTNETAMVTGTAEFAVSVSGTPPMYYQWRFSGTNLPGANNSVLMLTNLTVSQSGSYTVVVSNYVGSVTSTPADLNVLFITVEVNGQIDTGTSSAVSPATITILGGYAGGYLFYTIDGTTPTTSSPFYTGSFALTNSVTIQTLSLSSDFTQQAYGNPVNVQIIPTYNLQTSIVGFGTISTNPPGGLYASNSVVTLTATAGSTNWSFAHWAGDTNTTQDPLSITMNGPHNVQAVFVQSYYPLTLTTLGGGRVTANGVTIGASTYFVTNSLVALAATPSNGWVFMGWQGSITSTNNPYILNITQTNNIQAIFGANATTNSVGGAIVLGQPNPVPYGTKLTVSAIPNPGNYFALWNGALSGSASPTNVVVMTTNLGFGAFFSVLPTGKYSLSAVANGNGFVTVNPFQSYYNLGDSVTLTASTNPGAYFLGWSGAASGGSNPLTIQVASNEVVQANFGTGSSVSISPLSLTVLAGSNATLSANALGVQPLYYQWLNGQGAVAGATNATLVISNAQPASAGNYWVVVSNFLCMATSSVANITVIGAPMITNPPVPVTVTVGHNASFAVGAYGAPSLAYQWWLNGALVPGATNALLTIPNSFPANAGYYAVEITNVYGAATSSPVWLTVLPLNLFVPSKIVNGQFQITFDTASGLDYEVQYSTNMINWYPWLYVGGSGESQTLIDPFAGTNVSRFYRVILSQ